MHYKIKPMRKCIKENEMSQRLIPHVLHLYEQQNAKKNSDL